MFVCHSLDILAYFKRDSFTDWESKIYKEISEIFGYLSPYLFLWLAVMLNIAKWIYFFLVIKTHRSIREHEIEVELISDLNDSETVVQNILNDSETTSFDE